jgi:hypothetical protein
MVKPLLNNFNVMIEEQNKSPEQRLWKAVLAQAMYDLLSDNINTEEDGHRMLAECWASSKHQDFVDVCRNAGFEPDYIFKKVQKLITIKKLKKLGIVWNYKRRETKVHYEWKNNLSKM